MKVRYSLAGRTKCYRDEYDDCSVIALAHICRVPYRAAHKFLKMLGRNVGDGFYLNELFDVTDIAVFGKVVKEKYCFVGKGEKTLRLSEFADIYNDGAYLVNFKGHVCACINGTVYDTKKMIDANKRVLSAHLLVDKSATS